MSRIIHSIKKTIHKPKRIITVLANWGLFNWLSDERYLKLRWWLTFDSILNLDNPQTFNEKLQWLKLNDRNPQYSIMVDKIAVKEYVSSVIGEEYIIPTLQVWNSVDEIDFSSLPNRFVIKCNHNSGLGMYVCKDKSKLDVDQIKKKVTKGLNQNFYKYGREWPYKNVKPKVFAEQYFEDSKTGELRDYKFYCFGGKVKVLMINSDRGIGETKANYFDSEYNSLDFTWGYPHADTVPIKPITFEKMKELAEILSQNIPHVRVDFYEVDGRVYFGEMTFYDGSGFDKIEPIEWDYKLGQFLKLPSK